MTLKDPKGDMWGGLGFVGVCSTQVRVPQQKGRSVFSEAQSKKGSQDPSRVVGLGAPYVQIIARVPLSPWLRHSEVGRHRGIPVEEFVSVAHFQWYHRRCEFEG